MKQSQTCIRAFLKPASKRRRDDNAEEATFSTNERSDDIDEESNASRMESGEVNVSGNAPIAPVAVDVEDRMSHESLPALFDVSMLPNQLPSREGRVLQRKLFSEFQWMRLNHDGTCYCSCCLWASENNRLSAEDQRKLNSSRWAKKSGGWKHYHKGNYGIIKHKDSSHHKSSTKALQV